MADPENLRLSGLGPTSRARAEALIAGAREAREARAARRTIPAELGPLNWSTGRAYVRDGDFDELETLADGEVVMLRGEDGSLHRATVVGVEPGRLGRTWTLRLG
jgi:hypothetical protein